MLGLGVTKVPSPGVGDNVGTHSQSFNEQLRIPSEKGARIWVATWGNTRSR